MILNNSSGLTLQQHDPVEDDITQHNLPDDPDGTSEDERTQSEAIRRQVHYYFSDENLATDSFLTPMMHGHENRPVPLKKIHAFKAMRNFQPYQLVVDALKESDRLDVIQDGATHKIRRKVPYLGNLPSSAKKLPKPTTFEEYYSEAPLTPAEHSDDRATYDPTYSFALRIETAIQRYQAKRKLSNRQRNVFIKFLKFGGVTTGEKQFTGNLDADYLENATAAELILAKATSFVDEDKYETGKDRKWNVDFEGIAKAFLSSLAPSQLDMGSEKDVKICTDVLRNFYNYILYHEVCPEHTTEIFAARSICNSADKELPKTVQLSRMLPGDFNRACSALFGGFYKSSGLLQSEGEEHYSVSDKRAKRVIAYGMAAYGSDEDYYGEESGDVLGGDQVKLRVFGQRIASYENDGEPVGLEVVDVIYPDSTTRRLYDPAVDEDVVQFDIKPLGKLICKAWEIPSFTAPDLPRSFVPPARPELYEFWLEEPLLQLCSPGIKIEAVVAVLSSERRILDQISLVHCSFYTLSNNELLLLNKWKEPRMFTREEMDQIYASKENTLDEVDEDYNEQPAVSGKE